MQNEEQFASLTDAIRAAVSAALRGLFTALPASLTKDSDGHTSTAQSNILGLIRKDDGTMEQKALPPFDTIPVHFSGGGRMVSTHPVKTGDDGILLFMDRAIDSWHQAGGQQAPIDAREHHLSDAVFLNGLRADPKKLKNVAPDSHQVRSVDAKVTTDHHPDNGAKTKVVHPSDSSTDPFNSATKYHETAHHPTDGIGEKATDGTKTNTRTNSASSGIGETTTDGSASHTRTFTPSGGHSITVTKPGKSHTISIDPDAGISIVSSVAVGLSAPPGMLGLPAGGVGSSALASGAASSNVGTLGGDLSGTLPSPTVVGATGLPVYASNAAARGAGLAAGKLYANNTISGTERVVCIAF